MPAYTGWFLEMSSKVKFYSVKISTPKTELWNSQLVSGGEKHIQKVV